MSIYVKIYGLPRTGTNVIKALLEVNFKNTIVVDLVLGNKHDPYDPNLVQNPRYPESFDKDFFLHYDLQEIKEKVQERAIIFVVMIKNPYAWLWSYFKLRNKKNPNKFPEFSAEYFPQWLNLWRERNEQWITNLSRDYGELLTIIEHDQLIKEPENILTTFETRFNLKRNERHFVTKFDFATKRGTDRDHSWGLLTEQPFDHTYYTSKKYREVYNQRMKEYVDQLLQDSKFDGLRHFIRW